MKKDIFGRLTMVMDSSRPQVLRDARGSAWWARWLARWLLSNEALALSVLEETRGVPRLLCRDRDCLKRSWIDGEPMQRARPRDARYFRQAAGLLRRLHRANIAHNDLAKEPNWLVTPHGEPAVVDFQLALHSPGRGRLFRTLAREDLRHLLKHKRSYCPERLSRREIAILARPAVVSRIWMWTGKPLYLVVTRRILGWADREGAGDRS